VKTAKQITEWAKSLKLLVTQYNILRGIQVDEADLLELIDAKTRQAREAYDEWQISLEKNSNIFNDVAFQQVNLESQYKGLTRQVKELNQQYFETLDLEGVSIEKQAELAEAIGETTLRLEDLRPGLALTFELYEQTKEAQIDLLESQMALIVADALALENSDLSVESLERMGLVYDMLSEKLLKLLNIKKKDGDESKKKLDADRKLAKGSVALLKQFAGGAVVAARIQQATAITDTYSGATAALKPKHLGGLGPVVGPIAAVAIITQGLANVMAISKSIGEMRGAATGMDEIVTKPTLIMAGEGGRAESVQITPLEGPNEFGPQGGGSNITLNISAPLVDDTVVDSIIPAIREAIRRGEDIGIS